MKFTFLMSVYKNDDPVFLSVALESLFSQTYKGFALVIVQDGPIGKQIELVLDKWVLRFKRAGIKAKRVPLEKNVGLGAALSVGSRFVRTDYIVRMDSDDISVADRLEILASYLASNPNVDAVGTFIEEFQAKPHDLGLIRKVPVTYDGIKDYIRKRNPMNHVTVCMKKSALDSVGGYENVLWHEDYYLWFKMIKGGKILSNLDTVSVMVRAGQDMSGRRKGIRYVKAELSFIRRLVKEDMIDVFDAISYISLRLVVRVLPSTMVAKIYRLLRQKF